MPNSLILVVAREGNLTLLISHVLERVGWKTLTANLAQEARARFIDEVELLLTDCSLPDSSGEQLAIDLLDLKPSLRVCFMSGGLPRTNGRIPLLQGVNFIQKPFGTEALVSFINAIRTRNLE